MSDSKPPVSLILFCFDGTVSDPRTLGLVPKPSGCEASDVVVFLEDAKVLAHLRRCHHQTALYANKQTTVRSLVVGVVACEFQVFVLLVAWTGWRWSSLGTGRLNQLGAQQEERSARFLS